MHDAKTGRVAELSCFSVGLSCEPMDCSLPGSSVHGISQARIQEWVPFPPPGDLSNSGIESTLAALQIDSFTQ